MEDISDGVKILCERMASNPEDFQELDVDINTMSRNLGKFYNEGKSIENLIKNRDDASKWLWFLNQTEKDMLVEAYQNMMRQQFTAHVVGKLFETQEPTPKGKRRGAVPLTKTQIVNQSLELLNAKFDEEYVKYKATGRYNLEKYAPDPHD